MRFWSRLATWKKVLFALALLLVLVATLVVGLAARWLYLSFGESRQICILQGTRTLLFTTVASTRAIRPGADGRLEEISVRLSGRDQRASLVLPWNCITDADEWVPLFDWEDKHQRDNLTGKRQPSQWTNLLCLDLQTLEGRSILRTEDFIFPFGTMNCLDSRFMVLKSNYWSGDHSIPELAAIFNVAEATFSTIQHPMKAHRGLILLGEHDYLGIGYDPQPGSSDEFYSDKPGYLSRSGEKVADNVHDILAATPDLKRVFFVKHEPQASGATISALWTYFPNERTTQRLMEWKGEKLRVTSDSKRFGFLETKAGGQRNRRVIAGAHVFDVDGGPIRHFRFEEPIRPTGRSGRSFDWSPDWGVIAYFDESDIVVQSLEGEALGRFRLFRWSDFGEYLKSVKEEPRSAS